MIKLVAFDWNGTILADTHTVFKTAQEAYEFAGIKPTFAEFLEWFTVPIIEFYVKAGADRNFVLKNSKNIAGLFHKNYEEGAKKCRTRQYTRQTLEWLNQKNIDCVLFSNHTMVGVESQLDRLNLKKYFKKVIANTENDSAIKGEPKKIKLENYLKARKINPADVLVVGDAPEEIEIARDFGGISVAITHGNYSTSRLKAAKPDHLIYNLRQIEGIIGKL